MSTVLSFLKTFLVRKPSRAHRSLEDEKGDGDELSDDLHIYKIYPDSIIPTRGSVDAAGLDLYAYIHQTPDLKEPRTVILAPGCRECISTGIKIRLPKTECYGRIAPRSGTSNIKDSSGISLGGIDIAAGVIDRDFRGEIKIIIVNNSTSDFVIKHGQRIAQLIIEKTIHVQIKEVSELNVTARGANGFGSTGM